MNPRAASIFFIGVYRSYFKIALIVRFWAFWNIPKLYWSKFSIRVLQYSKWVATIVLYIMTIVIGDTHLFTLYIKFAFFATFFATNTAKLSKRSCSSIITPRYLNSLTRSILHSEKCLVESTKEYIYCRDNQIFSWPNKIFWLIKFGWLYQLFWLIQPNTMVNLKKRFFSRKFLFFVIAFIIIIIVIMNIVIKNSKNNILFKKKEKKDFWTVPKTHCSRLGLNLRPSSFLYLSI